MFIFTENTAGDFTYVHSSPRAHRYNNGTMVLSDAEEADAGAYLCQANNGIGAGLSKIVSLQVLGMYKYYLYFYRTNVSIVAKKVT